MKRHVVWGSLVIASMGGCAQNQNASVSVQNELPEPSTVAEVKSPSINADTRFAAGQLAASRGAVAQAIEQYQLALKLKPDHLGALYGLGCLQTQMRDFPEAIATWQRYVKATGGSVVAYSDLAYCEEASGRFAAAEADYRRGVAKDPRNENCRVNYGLLLARLGRIQEATVQLRAVLSEAEVHYNIASVYDLQGKKELAKAEYRKANALDPELVDAKTRLAALNN